MMRLTPDSDLTEVLAFLEKQEVSVLLFIDQQKGCKQYAEYPWVQDVAEVVEVDQEIVDHFQIGKVPQWRFYLKGTEVHHMVGTVARDELMEHRQKVFGNLRPFK